MSFLGPCIRRYVMVPCVILGDDSGFTNADIQVHGS